MMDDRVEEVLRSTEEDRERLRRSHEETRRKLDHALRSYRHERPRTQGEVCQNINAYWYERTHRAV